jgi:hypothetical protein
MEWRSGQAKRRSAMKRRMMLLVALLACVLALLTESPRQQARELIVGIKRPLLSVLFIGNSLTAANDLPDTLRRFVAGSEVGRELVTHAITPGGALLMDHWKNDQTRARLQQGKADLLILQGQSVEPVYGTQNFFDYAGRFKADADRAGTRTLLMSTWARPAGDAFYQVAESGGSPAEMQLRLNKAYAELAVRIGAGHAPVGVAWQVAQRDCSDIQLLDGSQHPSKAGTYLAAAVLFHAIFPAAAVKSSDYGGLPKNTALQLQRVAAGVATVTAPMPSN